jgi:hypothetical protein
MERKTIEAATADFLAELRRMSAERRDAFARAVLHWARDTQSGTTVECGEDTAVALDALCFAIDGHTSL